MVFRSRRSVRVENETERDSEGQKEWAHAAWYCSHVGPPLFLLGAPFLPSFLSYMLISIKNNSRKILRNSEKLSNTKVTYY